MSRVGKMPVAVPNGVEVRMEGARITVKGPKGELSRDLIPDMKIDLSDGVLTVKRPSDHPRHLPFLMQFSSLLFGKPGFPLRPVLPLADFWLPSLHHALFS